MTLGSGSEWAQTKEGPKQHHYRTTNKGPTYLSFMLNTSHMQSTMVMDNQEWARIVKEQELRVEGIYCEAAMARGPRDNKHMFLILILCIT